MERFGKQAPEVPVVLRAPHVGAGIPFDRVVKIRELEGVAEEEHRGVVAHQIPVSFLGVHLHGESADVALGVGRSPLPGHGGEADEQIGLLADSGEDFGSRVLGDVVGDGEGAEGAGAFGVHAALRDDFPVEVGEFLQIPHILQEHGPPRPGGKDVLVVRNGRPLVSGQLVFLIAHNCSPFSCTPRIFPVVGR